jgi:FAD:protein FMN transferase
MVNEGRQRAFKFFITACILSAMYYFMMETFGPVVEVDGGLREAMGTSARIIAVARNERKAKRDIQAGCDEFTRINKLLNDDINSVNQGELSHPVKVSPEFFEVLQTCIDYCKLSKGAFDITITDSNTGGYEKLILDSNNKTVRFSAAGLQLDLGGIDNSYAIDKAAQIMKRKGASGGLVDAGGIIRCFGGPASKGNWFIGMEEIKSDDANDINERGMVLKLRDCAAARLGAVTIIAPKAIDAELIALAVNAMGTQKGLDLVDSLLGVEAIIVTEEGVVKSRGADSYINR